MRAEGSAQYLAPSGELAYFVDDPYVEPGFSREAATKTAEVVIVGGGFAALSAGAHLRMAGIDDIRIVERAGNVGGTWYWNRYPGIQCDIESYVYLPLLEETGSCRASAMPAAPKSSSTPGASRSISIFIAARCYRRASPSCAGSKTSIAGW